MKTRSEMNISFELSKNRNTHYAKQGIRQRFFRPLTALKSAAKTTAAKGIDNAYVISKALL